MYLQSMHDFIMARVINLPVVIKILNKISLRSNVAEYEETESDNSNKSDYLVPNTIVAVASELSSADTVWFI